MKLKSLSIGLIFAALMIVQAVAEEARAAEWEVSGNIGFLSDYVFRGIHQSDASANGGVDVTYGSFYLGTWLADLDNDNGVEYDIYGGFDFGIGEHYHVGIGYTAFRYTDDDAETGFDDDYDEVNFYAGGAFDDFSIELEYSVGEHDNLDGSDNDYDFLAATFDYRGAFLTLGEFGISKDDEDEGEPDGGYIEAGYATTVSGIDLSASLISSDEELDSDGDGDETRLSFSANYAFGILGSGEE